LKFLGNQNELTQLFGRSDYVDLIDFLENIEHSLKIDVLEAYIKKLLNSLDFSKDYPNWIALIKWYYS